MTRSKPSRTLPAEWAPQSGVMLTWPHRHGDWADHLEAVEQVYLQLAQAICSHELLLVVSYDMEHQTHVERLLASDGIDTSRLRFACQPSNDSWARDHGPITVVENGQPRLMDFQFNGWGNKYPHDLDNRITAGLHAAGVFDTTPLESHPLVLEGGSIDTDGEGSLLTTRACLGHPQRNPQLSLAEIEQRLKELLGIERVLWLEHGELVGDDTDSHIDMLARFCNPHTIAHSVCNDPADEHFAPLAALQQELATLRQSNGQAYELVALPITQAIYNQDGNRLPASYANFLVINEAVLVPQYSDPADDIALERLRACFPTREVVGINCRAVIEQFGSLHCLTMQLPQGVLETV